MLRLTLQVERSINLEHNSALPPDMGMAIEQNQTCPSIVVLVPNVLNFPKCIAKGESEL